MAREASESPRPHREGQGSSGAGGTPLGEEPANPRECRCARARKPKRGGPRCTHQQIGAKVGILPPDPRGCLGWPGGHCWPQRAPEHLRKSQLSPGQGGRRGVSDQHGCVGAEPRTREVFWGLLGGGRLGLGGRWRSEVPLRALGAGARRQAGGQRRVRGKGMAVGAVEQEPDVSKLQQTSLARSCFSTVIPKSRTAVPAVGLQMEEISVMGESSRAAIPGQLLGASRLGPPCQLQIYDVSIGLLAPKGASCSPASTVRCRK